jgi:non-specific serine/threonine protein kinase
MNQQHKSGILTGMHTGELNCGNELELAPDGRLFLSQPPQIADGKVDAGFELYQAFARDAGTGLLLLGFAEKSMKMPVSLSFWQAYSARFLNAVRLTDGIEEQRQNLRIPFPEDMVDLIIESAPPLPGGEYLRPGVLYELWRAMNQALCHELGDWHGSVTGYFAARNLAWHQVDRLCFNLAENRRNPQLPFAFMATYTSGLSEAGKLRHQPLKNALEEYSGARKDKKLVELLQPLHLAGEKSELLQTLIASKRIFYPCGWSAHEAFRFLCDIPVFEEAGIMCRVPDWWKVRAKNRVTVTIKVGEVSTRKLDGSLLDFSLAIAVGDKEISPEEWPTDARKN